MPEAKKAEWSNEVKGPVRASDGIDRMMQELTPDEQRLKEMAAENKSAKPVKVDVTSKNPKAPRVIHDFYGERIIIQPGETVTGVYLHPNLVKVFSAPKSDLALTVVPQQQPQEAA